ncbi:MULTISPECIES: head GIN domain-containing protein [unclassified Flavobacterium]|uniref:head GIN domain-containing protein n=1 Tax=unclassified Flavobacterium TaxID=196869 RepID=UPI00361943EF
MIKLMIHVVKIVMAAIVALLLGSCKLETTGLGKSIKGSGNVVTKERNLNDFTKVEVKKGLECEVVQSSTFKVEVEADDNLQDGILTTVENGTLKITSKYNNYHNVASKKVKVFMPIIESLETNSGADLRTVGVIKSNTIHVKSGSGSSIDAEIESENITLESTSGSTIKASGKAILVNTLSSSGSSIEAERLIANEIRAQSTSGSSTKVNPILILNAQASSGSHVEYVNTPKRVTKQETSGGSVSRD